MGSRQVEVENGSGQLMPEVQGTWDVFTSFPLFGDTNPTKKQVRKFQSIGHFLFSCKDSPANSFFTNSERMKKLNTSVLS